MAKEETKATIDHNEEIIEEEREEPEAQDELEKLHAELEEAEAQAQTYLDGWQRAQAEFSNYKKRQTAERAQLKARVTMDVLRKVLPIVDDFERAMKNMPPQVEQLSWSEGISLIKSKLDRLLQSENVEPIEVTGQPFDPRYHEAVTYEEAPGHDEGKVIDEVQKGYMLGEHVLRPALVRVAKASSEAPSAENEIQDKEE